MIKKILLILILFDCSFAQYEKIRIGNIDKFYKDKVSYMQLENMIKEIEKNFETTLQMNIFDYSKDGKPIDLIYITPSNMEKRILKLEEKIIKKNEKTKITKSSFKNLEDELKVLKIKYDRLNEFFIKQSNELNKYIKAKNEKKNLSPKEYEETKKFIKDKKITLNIKLKELNTLYKDFNRKVLSYNNKIQLYNNDIRNIYSLNKELESLRRAFRKVKGKTFGQKEITLKTYYKDGKKVREKDIKHSMKKIEIYAFDSLDELKAILAHEIAHLVGIPHINLQNALMNPILQNNQIENLSLTKDDIINFKNNF
ncbi:matrixin family metalloprotease [Arcobacter sp.]|uniref:matrixin family metalloprotease n=1 Tax=unclassified Arcobacter TaxID=2593671 RepID=UPI003B00C3B1